MKEKFPKYLKDVDIKAFYFVRGLFYRNRVRVYLVLFLLMLRGVMFKTPYLNIIAANTRDVLDAVTLPLLLAIIVGFNSRKVIIVAVALFIPVAALSVLGRETLAEFLSNNIYVLLVIGVLGMIVGFVRRENE
jgi:hypothetical protein